MQNVLSVVGARPNFIKLAPVDRALRARGIRHVVVHTGQHFDRSMSDSFFDDLGIPDPAYNLEVGSGSHSQQTARIMERIEPVFLGEHAECVLVYGDVNSTVAAALVAAKLGVPIGHVEAGLRSRDWTMPEEINRVVTDRLSNLLFTPSRDADANLLAEGTPPERIRFVGNVMIDSLVHVLPKATAADALGRHRLARGSYVVATLHRPSNVDTAGPLQELLNGLTTIARTRPVIFPVHPRTRRRMEEFGVVPTPTPGFRLVEPIGYLEMLGLVAGCGLVITDSGGVQEETSFLNIPCLTVRPNTERPVTVSLGTNQLVASECDVIVAAAEDSFGRRKNGAGIELWDGHAADRIAAILAS